LVELSLAFVGFGTVGQGCAWHLVRNRRYLKLEYDFDYRVVAIADIAKGFIQNNEEGIDLSRALEFVENGKKLDSKVLKGQSGLSSMDTIKTSNADILIETTWTNLKDGEPGLSHIITALESGMDVVTSNKGPIALALRKLLGIARSRGRQLRFESTVMSGTPVFKLQEFGLLGARITRLRGILNGTTNYILTEMARGKNYEDALKRAQELGYAEADPAGDVEAYDPAAKITILANVLMDGEMDYGEVERQGINQITVDETKKAAQDSKRIKLIASASKNDDGKVRGSVKPTLVPDADILAHVNGVSNALQISMDVQPDVTIVGPGAGGDSAGYGLVSDILAIHRLRISQGK